MRQAYVIMNAYFKISKIHRWGEEREILMKFSFLNDQVETGFQLSQNEKYKVN